MVTKSQANYRIINTKFTCSKCPNFLKLTSAGEGACNIVAGSISENGTCDFYEGT
jgi:hypothetical protein